jgi:hypothetical protein
MITLIRWQRMKKLSAALKQAKDFFGKRRFEEAAASYTAGLTNLYELLEVHIL